MRKVFGLVRRGDLYLLRRLEYPHYKAWVDLSRNFPEIKEIEFLDKCCGVSKMANAINEGGIFLESYMRKSEDIPRQPHLAFFGIAFVLAYQLVSSVKIFPMLFLRKLTEKI